MMYSECGLPIANRSQAIVHAADCCSVGRLREVPAVDCPHCGRSVPVPVHPQSAGASDV